MDEDHDDEYPAFEKAKSAPRGNFYDKMEQRRTARDETVDAMRRYGMFLLAAAVLLPWQLVVLGLVVMVVVYMSVDLAGRARKERDRARAG